MKVLHHINQIDSKRSIGNKARSLQRMDKHGFPVPETYVIPMKVREAFSLDAEKVRAQIRKEIIPLAEKNTSWAIRSSGELEDLKNHSFAGQFSTFLDVKGLRAMSDSIEKVWESGDKVTDGLYKSASANTSKAPGMSVIIQEMVKSLWSGVAFSINPVTGRNEIVIEAVKGSGVQLVQDGVKPFRWTWCHDNWDIDIDADEELKEVLESLVDGIKVLQKAWGKAVDIEWAFDGRKLFYLQCREVTVSEFPTIYSNHISREVLPGMIKPLVWSVNIPLVNSAWIRLLEGLLGKLNIKPEALSKSFYYRAYFNMGTLGTLFSRMGFPNDSLESLMGRKHPGGKSSFKPGLKTMRYVPAMLGFLLSNLRLQRKFKKEFESIRISTNLLTDKLRQMKAADYQSYFEELHEVASRAAYYNILIPLSFQISNRILQTKLKKRGIPYEHLNFLADFPELRAYDPNVSIWGLQQKWASLPGELQARIEDAATLEASKGEPLLKDIHEDFTRLILQFGHFSESGNDFSRTPWREEPDFLFRQVCQLSEGGPGSREASANINLGSKGIPRSAYQRAGRFRLYREMISSEYTRCYGLFRELYMVTGQYLHEKALLDDPGDVFYLTLEQHNTLLDGRREDETKDLREKVREVRKEMDEYRELILPSVIYGDVPPPLPRKNARVLEGIPTSPGIYEGEVVVVRGYADFEKKVEGRVLVIPFSDVGWTPLLVRAGAIISESGGILSHASIIAREMSIPAISSVDHACSLKDGTRVKIDGSSGILILDD